jgi:hypothetical protein
MRWRQSLTLRWLRRADTDRYADADRHADVYRHHAGAVADCVGDADAALNLNQATVATTAIDPDGT